MAIEGWKTDLSLGKEKCKTERESWRCPNMEDQNDYDYVRTTYKCSLCGKYEILYDSEMC